MTGERLFRFMGRSSQGTRVGGRASFATGQFARLLPEIDARGVLLTRYVTAGYAIMAGGNILVRRRCLVGHGNNMPGGLSTAHPRMLMPQKPL